MRILHIIGSVNPAHGGPIEGILRQSECGSGHTKEIASLDRPSDPWVKDFPLAVYPLGERRPHRGILSHYGYTPDLIPWLLANVEKYDAVIVNGIWNFTSMAAALSLPKSNVPYFVFTHGMLDPWFRRRYPLKSALKQIFWLFFEGPLLAHAVNVLFTTQDEAELAQGQFFGYTYRSHVVGYGTSTPPPPTPNQSEAFERVVPGIKDRPYLLFLSRIHPKKGCDDLIKAFARITDSKPDLNLVIAGPDHVGEAAYLKRLAKKLGVGDKIHWPGMLKGDAKWGAFYGSEAFILPSHQENFGIVVAEALGCGIPVLISNRVNIWREIASGEAGIVESDGISGTELLIRKWISLSASARSAMGIRAKIVFHEHFEISRFVKSLELLIESRVHKNNSSD